MPRITISETEKIGQIERVVDAQYILPDRISCPEGDSFMFWDPRFKAYVCYRCEKMVTGEEFVKAELERASKEGEKFL